MIGLGERPADPALVFVGGTGRSGTHVVNNLLGRSSRYARVPIEARFHVNPKGFPDLLDGRITLDEFLAKLRGFWWRRIRAGEVAPAILRSVALGRKERGLYKIVPRERFEAAVEEFETGYDADPVGACRNLFLDLLWPLAVEARKPGLTEMSCFTIARAPTLLRLFPDARFVHSFRDGRDAGASKVSKRQKRVHPRDGLEGLRWWEGRLEEIELGVRGLLPSQLHAISLDELVGEDREAAYTGLLEFLGLEDEPEIRGYFDRQVSTSASHKGRWRERLSDAEQQELAEEYGRTLERIDAEGYHCAPILRRTYERQPA
jgi:hypothetical protein